VGWFELGLSVVGVESDLPGGVVESAVVVAAEQGEVVEGGGSVVGPVGDDPQKILSVALLISTTR